MLVVATHGNGIYSINLNNVCTVLGIEDNLNQDQSDIKIYPNPTNGNFKLDFKIDNPMDISWVVYSETGRIVQSKKVKKAISGNNQISVSLNGLSSGMYYITLNIGEKKITRQIIKQ